MGASPVKSSGSKTGEYLAQELAAFVTSTKESMVGDVALKQAELVLLDVVASASAGFATPAAVSARRLARSVWGDGSSPVWQTGERSTLPGAIFTNVAAATALDLDDGHRLACGHPAAGVVSVATAIAEREGRSGRALLTSIVVGYEVGVRVSAARDIGKIIDNPATGQWLSYATAATAGWLLGLDAARMSHALAIAGTLWPNLLVNAWSKEKGNTIKEGMPWSALSGYMAAEMAAVGFTGARDVLDGPGAPYDGNTILSGTGVAWAITHNYFKYYTACRHAHPSIDIILEMAARGELPETIERIDAFTYDRALHLNNYPAPPTIESAQYSLPFCIALAAIRGRDAVSFITSDHLADKKVIDLAHRVKLHADAAIQRSFPAQTGGRLIVTGEGRSVTREVGYCSGDWQTGDNSTLLKAKFDRVTSAGIDVEWRRRLPKAISELSAKGPEAFHTLMHQSARA